MTEQELDAFRKDVHEVVLRTVEDLATAQKVLIGLAERSGAQQDRIASLEQAVTALAGQVAMSECRINSLSGAVTSLAARLDSAETGISMLSNNVSSVSHALNGQQSRVMSAEAMLGSLREVLSRETNHDPRDLDSAFKLMRTNLDQFDVRSSE